MPRIPPAWSLIDFGERLDSWNLADKPSDDLRLIVTAWAVTRFDDPYQGMRRELSFDNLWYGTVPGTYDGHSTVVCCSYWILEASHTVRCNQFATLSLPG